ncbi:MAG: PIN domain-containing protein [Acidobacteria bacterium]|nr:PIN domain-containing protein [Acidobacteriota bacterium]
MAVIADTGPLYALADEDDEFHAVTKAYVSHVRETLIIPGPVLPEVCYLLLENFGSEAEVKFLRSVVNQEMLLEHATTKDLERVVEILEQYRDIPVGMVDASIMAIAERLKVETLLTLDRRHFTLLRPRHCSAFRLVPELPPRRKK